MWFKLSLSLSIIILCFVLVGELMFLEQGEQFLSPAYGVSKKCNFPSEGKENANVGKNAVSN
jgi:hypothetical protein